ncbi:hypothetical protein [Olsenella sp. Marseille-P4559]|uniref:hypothetical protein n=1 Tax=Olsenella sp. Marseille-P4559 TaxID=2364795 RepID=UPI00103211BA|nr:hypothetical protein [Olsenella sp. Marseille-P4559]
MTLSLEDRLVVAGRALGRSVVAINPHAREEASHKCEGFSCLGVKDDAGLPQELLDRFLLSPDWLVLTVDHKADLGRSVDTELVNPLTYRAMTGSTSGGPINVLKGVNDVCIGTDGGGSVLAPALATNLFAVMGKGLGLLTTGEGRSTDGLVFRGGVGFIRRGLGLVISAAELACGESLAGGALPRVVAPVAGSTLLPGGEDMRKKVDGFLTEAGLPAASDYAFSDVYDRKRTVPELGALWEREPLACVVTFEGPIDVLSADETIPRGFGGVAPDMVAHVRSKAVCKSVNMAGGSAVCVPTGELACGLLVSCGPGVEAARGAVRLAHELAAHIQLPEMLVSYFHDRQKPPRALDLF